MELYAKQFSNGFLIPRFTILIFLSFLSFSAQSQSAPQKPNNVQISWKKDKGNNENNYENCPICKLTLTVTPSTQGGAATSYNWEIWRLGSIEYQKTTTGKIWAIGYIEPTDTYTVKVKAINAAGQSEQFIKVVNPPSGCCVQ